VNPEKYLIVGPSWVGDMVMAQSLCKVLKAQQPEAEIEVLAPPWSEALLARMPEVSASVVQPLGHGQLGLFARYQLGKQLRGRGYTQALVLPNSFKSALVPFWARIPRRTGYVGEWRYGLLNDARVLQPQVLRRTVDRFVALALPVAAALPTLPIPRLQAFGPGGQAACAKFGLNGDRPVLGLCPGAEYGPAKRWPTAHYAAVARQHLRGGGQVWLFGSAKDALVGAQIAVEAGAGCVDLCGRTSLAEAIDLLALTSAVVSNDSGLMHVAAALDKPLVALYGSSDPGFTPPLSPRARVLSLHLPCSPCFKRECPLGHLQCLTDLTPAQVNVALAALQ